MVQIRVSPTQFLLKCYVRCGIRTHALIRGPEFSSCSLQGNKAVPWVWRLRPLGQPDSLRNVAQFQKVLNNFWAVPGSNWRPSACKADVITTTLTAHGWIKILAGTTRLSGEKIFFVRSGIRTHAHRSGLRPERSALDLSAILTSARKWANLSALSFPSPTHVSRGRKLPGCWPPPL